VATGGGFAWVAIDDANVVVKVDAATNQIVGTISFPWPTEIVFANGFAWAGNQDGAVGRINPATDSADIFHLAGDPTIVGMAFS
jgi:hypothetical protein